MAGSPKFLYHYTSLETLALILTNKTLCFNSLLNVDDMEEAEAADMKQIGKFVYVSCWTSEKKESIPMWNLYTPDMHGIRLRLPAYPFKKYHYKAGQHHLKDDVETFINYDALVKENKGMITSSYPELIKVGYANDKALLFPKVKTLSSPDAIQRFLSANSLGELNVDPPIEVSYSHKGLGRYKRTDWRFQKEWRYLLFIGPAGLSDTTDAEALFKRQQEFVRNVESEDGEIPYKRFFMEIDDNALKQAEIVLGPKMSEAEKILAKALLETHGLASCCRESNLKIR